MKNFKFLPALCLLLACSLKPQPIEYGLDQCHFCKMNIVDNQFAAEWVTQKGRVYKFDAIECMARQLNRQELGSAHELVCDYLRPGEMLDAGKAAFLISPGIPSPMGEFLSAFQSVVDAESQQEVHGGQVYAWEQILARYEDENLSLR